MASMPVQAGMEEIATWVAPIATTIAALMTASNLGSRITGYGFVVFTVGSLAWLALGAATGQANLVWQNVILTALNLFGIWRWLGRQARIEDGASEAQARSRHTPGETLFPASMLGKADVVAGDGEKIGQCVDAMVSADSGCIAYVVVSDGGVAGVGETLRRLDWSAAKATGSTIRAVSVSNVERLPVIPKEEWPAR